jgi:hypothetical protein
MPGQPVDLSVSDNERRVHLYEEIDARRNFQRSSPKRRGLGARSNPAGGPYTAQLSWGPLITGSRSGGFTEAQRASKKTLVKPWRQHPPSGVSCASKTFMTADAMIATADCAIPASANRRQATAVALRRFASDPMQTASLRLATSRADCLVQGDRDGVVRLRLSVDDVDAVLIANASDLGISRGEQAARCAVVKVQGTGHPGTRRLPCVVTRSNLGNLQVTEVGGGE